MNKKERLCTYSAGAEKTTEKVEGIRDTRVDSVAKLLGGTGVRKVSHNVPVLLQQKKVIDLTHLLDYSISNPPKGFHWKDNCTHSSLEDIFDTIMLYSGDLPVGELHIGKDDDGKSCIINASCIYSKLGIQKFISFLGQATDDTYGISPDCPNYRNLCTYFESIYTELDFNGRPGRYYDYQCSRKY